jgi:hypothetical protein
MVDRYFRIIISIFFLIILLVLAVNGYIWSRKKSLGQSDDSSSNSYITVIVYRNGDWTKGQSIQLSKEECSDLIKQIDANNQPSTVVGGYTGVVHEARTSSTSNIKENQS